MVDTREDVSVITTATAKRIGREILPRKRKFTRPDGSILGVVGKVRLSMILSLGQEVTNTNNNNLVGRHLVKRFKLVRTVRLVKEEAQPKHPQLFRELRELPDVFRIHLENGAVPLCLNAPRRVPIVLSEATRKLGV